MSRSCYYVRCFFPIPSSNAIKTKALISYKVKLRVVVKDLGKIRDER